VTWPAQYRRWARAKDAVTGDILFADGANGYDLLVVPGGEVLI
jgi:hypothetical protein